MKLTTKLAAMAIALGVFLALIPVRAAAARLDGDAGAGRCAALSRLQLAHTEIVQATYVAAKATALTAAGAEPGHRAFCRVVARVRAEPQSDIGIELWLPVEGWTGTFHGNGNGGFSSSARMVRNQTGNLHARAAA